MFIFGLQKFLVIRLMPRDTHVWNMFIEPDELIAAFKQYSFSLQDMQGAIVSTNPLAALWDIQQQGRITFADMRRRLQLNLDPDLSLNYLGYARKPL